MNAIGLNRECSLTDLDWRVVEIARTDGARSLNPDGHFARFLRDFFGLPVPRALSNERAEALRRFSVRRLPRRTWDTSGRRVASIARARRLLGYRPRTALPDGLARTIEWFHENMPRINAAGAAGRLA